MDSVERKDAVETIWDSVNRKYFIKGSMLGKGAFGKCYELTDVSNGHVYAAKIIDKSLVKPRKLKEKIVTEIAIHKTLNHKHIVEFINFFDDAHYIYIVLELCKRRSMMELHKRRRILTDPEVRYYTIQILSAVKYLHDNNIIHRDLKLDNIFINDEMEIKVGDFGLATKIDEAGEKRKTLCGTPNYIAPEILEKSGHGTEVDVWSFGCILYTLLVGKPPFESKTLEDTYSRVKKCEYRIPFGMNEQAAQIARRIFIREPRNRPNASELIEDAFFTNEFIPQKLPTSCLIMEPYFEIKEQYQQPPGQIRTPLKEINTQIRRAGTPFPGTLTIDHSNSGCFLQTLKAQLAAVIKNKPSVIPKRDDIEDPALQPVVWVSSWIDYSAKYGFGYKLSDNSIGISFIDSTKMVLLSDNTNMYYVDRYGNETYFTVDSCQSNLEKKVMLLGFFIRYMGRLKLTGGSSKPMSSDCVGRLPILKDWMRYSKTVVMLFSNGMLQINYLPDHSKLIICSLTSAVTYIDKDDISHTFKMELIEKHGCPPELDIRLHYALRKVTEMLNNKIRIGR